MFLDRVQKEEVEALIGRWEKLTTFLKIEEKRAQLAELQKQLAEDDLWQSGDHARAQALQQEARACERFLEPIEAGEKAMQWLQEYFQLYQKTECSEADRAEWDRELIQAITEARKTVDSLELQAFLSGPMDENNAIVTIHAGAGGTEACDWAQMVFRMYTRWIERKGFLMELQSLQNGEEAGISSVTFRVEGLHAYGYLKAERGVHRLVRISPFNANRKRHTSFCAVDVIAELKEEVEVPIDEEKDLKIDVFRSSGAGGQHVNKTESAVRITHLPTGIVVTCQNERSQMKNRASALSVLKARLYERMQDEKRSALERFYGEKGEIGWGCQIRSYVFQPYQMVKDLRTQVETGNVQAVMDGDLDLFIEAWLRAGKPRTRQG